MRSAVVLLSLLAVAAAHPHTPPLHNRHSLVRRQPADDTDDAAGGASAGAGDAASSSAGHTTSAATETSALTTTSAHTTTATRTTEDEDKPSPSPTKNTNTPSVAPTTSTPAVNTNTHASSAANTSATDDAAASSADVDTSSAAAAESASSAAAATSAASSASGASAVGNPLTSASTTTAAPTSDVVETSVTVISSKSSTVIRTVSVSRASASASSTSKAADNSGSSGIPKGALIAIIVIASIVGTAVIVWTLFRKWKLRPSNRFDNRMRPIDFSPNNDRDMNDDFIEKTLQRSNSGTSADRQRQQFVADLDHNNNSLTAGIPDHDFTAGSGHANYQHQQYDPDPYEYDSYGSGQQHQQQQQQQPYDFSSPRNDQHPEMLSDHGHQYDGSNAGHAQYVASNQGHQQAYDYPQVPEPSHAVYPPQPGAPAPTGGYYGGDYPTQDMHGSPGGNDTGYSNLQRGPSVGHTAQATYPSHPAPFDPLSGMDFAIAGRPTGADAGAYAQAAAFRY